MAKLQTTLTLALLLAGSMLAGDVTGKWSGTVIMKTPDGNVEHQPAWMSLKQAGNVLTGTAGPTAERQSEIKEGKVDGDQLEFKVMVEESVVMIKLRSEGDSLKGDAVIDTPDGKMTASMDLKRVP